MKEFIKNNKTIVAIFIMVIGALIVIIGNSFATTDSTILSDRIIDNLTFKDASLEYEKGSSTYSVSITNNNDSAYTLKYINKKVTLPGDNIYNLVGYVGTSIGKNETRILKAAVDVDLTNATNIEYSIVK